MKPRQSSFELIRIIAMLMIIGAHYVGHGILKVRTPEAYSVFLSGETVNRIISVLYSPGGKIGVALFFMITGYFLANRKDFISQKKVVLQCVFYAILLTVATIVIVFFHLSGLVGGGTIFDMVKTLPIPISSGSWWFVSTYVLVVLLAPLLNRLVENVNNKGVLLLVLYFGVLYGIFGFGTAYYNIIRAPFYYLAGAVIRKRNILINKQSYRYVALFVFVVMWLFYSASRYFQIDFLYNGLILQKVFVFLSDYLMSGVFIPIGSIFFFLFLTSFDFSNGFVNKIASTTFGVYLLHDSNIGRKLIWNEFIRPEVTQFPLIWYQYALISFATIVGIFIACGLIDLFRQHFFERWMECRCDSVVAKIKEHCFLNNG